MILILIDRCSWQLWAVVLLMTSFIWMGKQKKIIFNNKDTALRLSGKAVVFGWIRQIVTESVGMVDFTGSGCISHRCCYSGSTHLPFSFDMTILSTF
jgi:hypothetical protein